MSSSPRFQTATSQQALKDWITNLGLKPLALRLFLRYQSFVLALKRRHRVVVAGAEVVFVTEDARSKWFFHRRYRPGQLHEPPVTLELVKRVRDARVFVDVGAHVGYFGCIAGGTNRHLRLFLFEMNRNLIPVIERNLCANHLENYQIINRPVSDRIKTVTYDRSTTDPGLSLLSPRNGVDGRLTYSVETITLDDFFLAQEIVPDVLKIDVQGAELEALLGAEELIRRHHPILFVEIHPDLVRAFGARIDELYDFLVERYGYQLRRIDEHRRDEGRLVDVSSAAALPRHTHMLLCV